MPHDNGDQSIVGLRYRGKYEREQYHQEEQEEQQKRTPPCPQCHKQNIKVAQQGSFCPDCGFAVAWRISERPPRPEKPENWHIEIGIGFIAIVLIILALFA